MASKDTGSLPTHHEDTALSTSRLRTWATRFCILAISIYCIGWVLQLTEALYYISNFRASQYPHPPYPQDDNTCDLHDIAEDPLPAVRTVFGSLGTIVYGWPSTGGVWIKEDCYGVEMEFLGLNRFNATPTQRKSDPQTEDAFCQRLEYIGARFWETEYAYNKQVLQRDERRKLWAGWPGEVPDGGSWSIWLDDFEAAELGVSRIRNAFTMQERCEAIEMMGGHYLERWRDVLRSENAEENDMFYDTEL